MSAAGDVPEGYLQDAKGRLVPAPLVRPIDLARHELVIELVERARAASAALATFRKSADDDIDAFVALSAEKYDAKLGRTKGNLTLTSYDGKYKVLRQIQDRLVFDERLQVAKALVDECILEWSAGSRDEIRALVAHAFQTDKAGRISVERVLGLRRVDIQDARWTEAMTAISDSVQVSSSRAYLRFYERIDGTDDYRPINLDLSAT